MLKKTLAHVYDLADQAQRKFGGSPAKVTDDIIEKAFPQTFNAAMTEGCDRMFREGVVNFVKGYIRKPPADDRQRTFNDIDENLLPRVEPLGSVAYWVPSLTGGEFVSVPDLCHDITKLDAARKFMRLKGDETLIEADKLDALYFAAKDQTV